MKIIKTRFNITKLPAGKVVRQFDIDNIAENSFVKKFGDKPAYMGYGMEGSGSLAAREYAEKVATKVYFKKLRSELTKTRKITATGMKSLKSSGTPITKTRLQINKAIPVKQSKSYKPASKYLPPALTISKNRGAMKADIIARTEADIAMDRIMERYTTRKAKSFRSAEVKPKFISNENKAAMGFTTERKFAPSAKVATQEDIYALARSERKVKYKKPKIKTSKSNFQTEFKSYISKEFKL